MKSLLIIDDDEDMGDALLSFFKEEGYRVCLASSGKEGLLKARADVPQVILLDWQMPQMGGREVLAELAAAPKLRDVPVILMSANVTDIPADILLVRKHLNKPFDMDVLIGLVAEASAE